MARVQTTFFTCGMIELSFLSTVILQKRELLELKAKFTQLEKDAQEELRLPTFLKKKIANIEYFLSSFFPAPPPSIPNLQYCK
jgi:hypothetical protein